MSLLVSLTVAQLAIALPPPLCRGRVVGRYDPSLDASPSPRALAEVKTAYDTLCPRHNCGKGELRSNPTIGNNAATRKTASPAMIVPLSRIAGAFHLDVFGNQDEADAALGQRAAIDRYST